MQSFLHALFKICNDHSKWLKYYHKTCKVFGIITKEKKYLIILDRKVDIVCFQETHSLKDDEIKWRNEWRGVTFYSHGSENSRGVLIAIKTGIPINVEKVTQDKEGRYMILQYCFQEQKFVIVNLYAPNRDIPQFFVTLFHAAEEFEGKRIFC